MVAQVEKMGAVLDKRGPGGQERIYINMTQPPFDDIRVRQAFMHAIDRQAIKDTLYPGALATLADSPLPPGYFGHIAVPMPEYDPNLAKKLLTQAAIRTVSLSTTISLANPYARCGLSAPRGCAKYLGAESQAGQHALSF
jgi:peptide/nickel transport system substrate-binding protein